MRYWENLSEEEKQFWRDVDVAQKIFDLFQSHGFPPEISLDLLEEKGWEIDKKEIMRFYKTFEEAHKIKSKNARFA